MKNENNVELFLFLWTALSYAKIFLIKNLNQTTHKYLILPSVYADKNEDKDWNDHKNRFGLNYTNDDDHIVIDSLH